MNIHEEIELQDCPFCGGAGWLAEEHGWCWSVTCLDCGAQTAALEFKTPEERVESARKAAYLWNIGKIMKGGMGE